MPYRLVKLANGAYSLHSLAHRETFHPVIGPVAEVEALYVRQLRLVERLRAHRGEFVIWDVGLGAAANALTILRAVRGQSYPTRLLSFDHTLEPLEFAMQHLDRLDYLAGYEPHLRALMAGLAVPRAEGRTSSLDTRPATLATRHSPLDVRHSPQRTESGGKVSFRQGGQPVTWELHLADFPSLLAQPAAQKLAKPHVIMFDAFSPATNPAMWTELLFARLFRLLDPQRPCALPTYSRSTMLRVTLLLAGFFVGAGHATGEKEETTIAANTLDLIEAPLGKRWLQRARRSCSAEPLQEPVYSQAPLSEETWARLLDHHQFKQPI